MGSLTIVESRAFLKVKIPNLVVVWVYTNLKKEDILTSYKNGRLEIALNGKKLKGGYALVKMKNRDKHWLLIKMKDQEADGRRNPVSTEKKSVKSGKTIKEI